MKKITVAFTSSYLSFGHDLPKIEKKIVRELRKLGAKVLVFNIDDIVYVTDQKEVKIYAGKVRIDSADVLFVRRRRYREMASFELAHIFEGLKKTVIDSAEGVSFVINKTITDPHLFQQRFFPKTVFVNKIDHLTSGYLKQAKMTYPLIVKPQNGTKQRGIRQVNTEFQLLLYPKRQQKRGVVIQEKVNTKFEYRVLVIGGKSIGAVKKEKDFSFRREHPVDFEYVRNKKVERFAERAVKHLPGDIYGLDIAEDVDGKLYMFESNRNPSFGNFEKKSGINIEKEIATFVINKSKIRKRKRKI